MLEPLAVSPGSRDEGPFCYAEITILGRGAFVCWSEFWDGGVVLSQHWCMCQPHISSINSENKLVILKILCFFGILSQKASWFSGLVTWRQLAKSLGFFKGGRAWCLQHRRQNNLAMRAEDTYVKTWLIRHRSRAKPTRRRRHRNKHRKLRMASSSLVKVDMINSTPPPAASLSQHASCSSGDGVAS